jgi:flagellar hook-associated protein 3 FlgL
MRISTSWFFQQGLNAMQSQQATLAKTEQQLSTGQRILTPSDDPAAAARVMGLDKLIETTGQYQRNADAADTRLKVEESVLANAGDLLQRIRELSVQANNDTLSAEDRGAIALEVRAHLDGLLQLANSKDGNNDYLFAGYKTGTKPFLHDGMGNFTYAGDQGDRIVQIGASRQVSTGDSGDGVFMHVDDGAGGMASMFSAVYDFAVDLEADNPSQTTLTRIDSALQQVSTARASVGARLNAIESQRGMNDAFVLALQQNRSSLADLDYAEASSRFQQQMLAMQASQQTFVKLQGLSLFNYL